MQNRVRGLAVIDTSGSIDDETLASVAAILQRIEDVAELIVVECDAKIQRVYPFNGVIRSVMGRGGTDFCPPFERAFLAKTGAEAVIYFTDGEGPAPKRQPHVPVIWALTHEGKPPVTWGRTLRVEST
jgi:predicted metal-dependent peptidase